MGFFDLFKKKEKGKGVLFFAPTQNGRTPTAYDGSRGVYMSDVVMQSIRCKANEFIKLDPRHIRIADGEEKIITDSSIARVLKRPNEHMTQAEFLEKICIQRELTKNAYIYPDYYMTKGGQKHIKALYPLTPDEVTYLVDAKNAHFVKLHFSSGYEVTLPASDIIHWKKDFGFRDYFGGNGNDNRELLAAVERYEQICESISKAVGASCQINGVVKVNTYMDDDAAKAQREAFAQRLENNESGILVMDLKGEYMHIPRDVKLVDAETIKFFYETISRANGVSAAILSGDYTKAQKEAFYEHALEADIKSLGQALSKFAFSDREAQFGNEIICYPNSIYFMSMENRLSALQVGLPAGLFSKNVGLRFLGLPPIPGGDVMPRGYNELDMPGTAENQTETQGTEGKNNETNAQ